MTDHDDDEKYELRLAPIVRADMPEGPAAVRDRHDDIILADGWVKVKCVGCDDEASAPKAMAEGLTPDENGIYFGMCGKCAIGKKIPFSVRETVRQTKRTGGRHRRGRK